MSSQKRNEVPDGSHSDASDQGSILETTGQIKGLKGDNKHIKRRCPKRKSKLITWGDIKTLIHQAETVGRQQGHNTADPKMMLLYLLIILHVNYQLVNAEFK